MTLPQGTLALFRSLFVSPIALFPFPAVPKPGIPMTLASNNTNDQRHLTSPKGAKVIFSFRFKVRERDRTSERRDYSGNGNSDAGRNACYWQ